MSPKEKSGRPTKLPLHRKPAPLTIERLVPLFEDMKDFVRATVRGSETMLREEFTRKIDSVSSDLTQKIETVRADLTHKIETVRADLTKKIETVRTELGGKIDAVQCAITEHSKSIKAVATDVKDHEDRLIHSEQHVL